MIRCMCDQINTRINQKIRINQRDGKEKACQAAVMDVLTVRLTEQQTCMEL